MASSDENKKRGRDDEDVPESSEKKLKPREDDDDDDDDDQAEAARKAREARESREELLKTIVDYIKENQNDNDNADPDFAPLKEALITVLQTHKVCTLRVLDRALRELHGQQGDDASFDIPPTFDDLEVQVNRVAQELHGVYVLKILPNAFLRRNVLRRMVIMLLMSEPDFIVIKRRVLSAVDLLGLDPLTDQQYRATVEEHCVSRKGGWMLKSGDGNYAAN